MAKKWITSDRLTKRGNMKGLVDGVWREVKYKKDNLRMVKCVGTPE